MGGGSGSSGAGGNSSIGDGIGGYGTGIGTNGGGLGGLAGAIGAAGDAAAAAGMGSVSGDGMAGVGGGDAVIAPRQPGAPPSGTLLAPATDTLLSARGSANARKLSRRSAAATSSSQGGDGQIVSKTLLGQ